MFPGCGDRAGPPGGRAVMNRKANLPDPLLTARAPLWQYDLTLLFSVLLLVGIGLVMVYSASSAVAMKKFHSDIYFLKKQAMYAALGVVAMVACRSVPLTVFRAAIYPMLALSVIFLVAVQLPEMGVTAGGATRWLRLGQFSFQPSEFARFALVAYLAYSMSRKHERIREFAIGFLPHVLVLALISLLISLQPDFGSVVILGAITWLMLFVGGVRLTHLGLSIVVFMPFGFFFLTGASYRLERLTSFFDPWAHATDGGYQIVHSLMAFGTGGIWGKGIGQGYQKLFYLPEPHTDFIFSVIGEELGLAGVMVILALYLVIFVKGVRIALRSPDRFTSYLAAGITIALCLQVGVNMGVALALLPTKGLTLPFLSYGGTSLLLNMASVGLLMNVGALTDGGDGERD